MQLLIEQFARLEWSDVTLLDENNKLVDCVQGLTDNKVEFVIESYKKEYPVKNASLILYNSDERMILKKHFEKGEF